MKYEELAQIIFPDVTETVYDLEKRYSSRNLLATQQVSRFAPSPTGFLHTGSLFTSMLAHKVAVQTNGVFYIRLEDTDTKRTIEGVGEMLIAEMKKFGITPNEGYLGTEEIGNYGPYKQSERRYIYRVVLKHMIQEGLAYPCFCTEQDLTELRIVQEQNKAMTGYFGEYAVCRHLKPAEAIKKIKAGVPYVIRYRSPGNHKNKIDVHDLIRGKISIAENDADIVILKSDGLPTYHLAHVVDDHFMKTTIVVRGEEWISSLPLHYQLFMSLGWNPPTYAHLPVIMKVDETTGNKRKLSKRHDPEAAVSYFLERGIPTEAVVIYLMTIANSNFEEWILQNGLRKYREFEFSFDKVSFEGALFDMKKLLFYAKEYLAQLSAAEITFRALEFGKSYQSTLEQLINRNPSFFESIMNIEREQEKPRKDYAMLADILPAISFFYDDLYINLVNTKGLEYRDKFTNETIINVLKHLKKDMPFGVDEQSWFAAITDIGIKNGFAPNNKVYKSDPDSYLGQPGDVAEIIRVAITTSVKSPSLNQVLNILGRSRVNERIDLVIARLA